MFNPRREYTSLTHKTTVYYPTLSTSNVAKFYRLVRLPPRMRLFTMSSSLMSGFLFCSSPQVCKSQRLLLHGFEYPIPGRRFLFKLLYGSSRGDSRIHSVYRHHKVCDSNTVIGISWQAWGAQYVESWEMFPIYFLHIFTKFVEKQWWKCKIVVDVIFYNTLNRGIYMCIFSLPCSKFALRFHQLYCLPWTHVSQNSKLKLTP